MDSLLKFVRGIHSRGPCASGNVKLIERSIERFGISSSLFAKCHECGMEEFMATGEHDGDQETPRTIQGKDINRRVVYAAFEMGIGREGVAKLCEILNMLFSISIDTWYNHEEILHAAQSHQGAA
ncbi:uncharacterized protein LOC111334865 [Stylophora pistillata]|uniref:uncharacterized protein LOC111334865 n=1 Tax=Stylophora pistillata TaxID=50429 RepID=UPI000C04794A|nr:uncharacterized protein LOC111334865 [Stylophora pistillata]